MVLHMWATAPHELRKPEQVLQVVARLPSGHCDLGTDLLRGGRAQVERVVGGGNVNQRLNRRLVIPLREEIHHFGHVASADRLSHIQVLQGLLQL